MKLQKFKKYMIYFFYLLIFLFITNATIQFIKEFNLFNKYHPPGKMVSLDGLNLHFNCSGVGSKTVLFESGAGMFSLEWSQIQKMAFENIKNVQFCSYDRAGLGWSDPSKKDFSILNEVDDLHKALFKLGIDKNIYFVAHSYGGFIASVYSQKYKESVKGIILVDSNTLHYFDNNLEFIKNSINFSYILKLLAPVGMIQLFAKYILKDQIPPGENNKTRFIALSSSRKSLQALAVSGINFESTIDIVRNYSIPKNIPIIIVSRGLKETNFGSAKSEFDWREGHRILNKSHPLSRIVIAEKSDHMIPINNPN